MKYDYFVAGRARNRDQIFEVTKELRAADKKVYCFIDNTYLSDKFNFKPDMDPEESMKQFEAVDDWRSDKTFQEIFKADMDALRESEKFIVVFPAGLSAHMEIGVAYGMGKPCYSIGEFEKPESLYLMLEKDFSTVRALLEYENDN